MKSFSLTEKQFLDLLRSGLQAEAPQKSLYGSPPDWPAIIHMARRQAVSALVYDGMTRLPQELRPSRRLLLEWYADTLCIERANMKVNQVLSDVYERYNQEGLTLILLKGQGLAQYYTNPLHRQTGDIDLLFEKEYSQANQIAHTFGTDFDSPTLHHTAYSYKGVTVENHCRYVYFYAASNRKAWAEWSETHPLDGEETLSLGKCHIPVPNPTANAIYVLLHLQHHFLNTGVGLRQVCDWIRLLTVRSNAIDRQVVSEAVCNLPIGLTLPALQHIAVRWLGLNPSDAILPDRTPSIGKLGALMLRDMMDTGNFGQDTAIGKSLRRGGSLDTIKAYALAQVRYARIHKFCPSEVEAYPIYWLKKQCKKLLQQHRACN